MARSSDEYQESSFHGQCWSTHDCILGYSRVLGKETSNGASKCSFNRSCV